MNRRVLPLVLCVAGCERPVPVPGVVRVTVVRLGKDTIRFTAPAQARRCLGGTGWLVSGQQGGNGALVWFRPAAAADSTGVLKGTYALRSRSDTTTGRAAFVAVRFMITDAPHGLNLDAGSAQLVDTTAPISARIDGMGLEALQAQQVNVVASFDSLRVGDSTPCNRS